MRVHFNITICGYGNTPEEAWRDAVDALAGSPGPVPDEYFEEEEDDFE